MFSLGQKCLAEFIGTFWLVLGGCGSAVLAAAYTEMDTQAAGAVGAAGAAAAAAAAKSASLGIGTFGVSIAFGLTIMSIAYAIGHISGCHLNPAVSFGLWAAKRLPGSDLLPYIGSQVFGGIAGGGMIWLLAAGNGRYSFSGTNPLATNGFGDHSPQSYTMLACFIAEVVLTFMFLMIILGATDKLAPAGFAPIAIGLGLSLIHLISIPLTNTSVNPARSLGVAVWVAIGGNSALLGQVWFFWLAPIFGAVLAGWLYSTAFVPSSVLRSEREVNYIA
jgi:aquaporin Z